MVLGNPYVFSIVLDVVDKWNSEDSYSFYNGILVFYIGGEIFPRKMISATLGSEVPNLVEQFSKIPVNEMLFDVKKEEAFLKIYYITHPEDVDIDNDYSYDITPYCFGDINSYVFAVSNGKQVRILASSLERGLEDNIEIAEVFISMDDVDEVISKLKTLLSQQVFLNENYNI